MNPLVKFQTHMRKKASILDGQIVHLQHTSAVLADNPLNDPCERQLPVYLPAAYNRSKKALPVLFDLAGYTGAGPARVNWKNFELSIPERLDRLLRNTSMPPCIVVFPDCFTALGGNQYVNSSAIGAYADYLTQELIPLVDGEFRTKAGPRHRGCFGKSSGGYGALLHGMYYPKAWGAIASHSPDCLFDFVYRSDWPGVLTHLQRWANKIVKHAQTKPGQDDGRVAAFLDYCWQQEKLSGQDITSLMLLCMAATYDPDPEAPLGFALPFDLNTGSLIDQRWRKWLAADPLNLVRRRAKTLRSLRGIFLDCGWFDQYHLHFGTRQLSAQMNTLGIKHQYQEFAGTHSGIDHRLDISLPYLARRLA